MNHTIIPAKAACTRCNYQQQVGLDYCGGCGASFVFGKQDAWKNTPLQDAGFQKSSIKCMWEGVPPGTVMGMVCPCPKCTPYAMPTSGYYEKATMM